MSTSVVVCIILGSMCNVQMYDILIVYDVILYTYVCMYWNIIILIYLCVCTYVHLYYYMYMCIDEYIHVVYLHVVAKVPISLEESIVGACRILELEPTVSFQSNVIHFIQLVQAHKMVTHTLSPPTILYNIINLWMFLLQVVIVGPPCCGKTSCATVGAEALRQLGYSVLSTKVNLNHGTQSITGSWNTVG